VQLNGLHGVISQKMILFITTAVKTSNPKYVLVSSTSIKCSCSIHDSSTGYHISSRQVSKVLNKTNETRRHDVLNAPADGIHQLFTSEQTYGVVSVMFKIVHRCMAVLID
jgi:hypothetical protein